MGALKGAPCTVKTTEVTDVGLKVIFEWQDEGGTSHTTETIIPAGPQGQRGLPGTPGAQDAYAKDSKVTHNGKKWISSYDANVWEPGVYGWEEQTA